MNKYRILSSLFMVSTLCVANAAEHHSGHAGMAGNGSGGTGACLKPQFAKFLPANLATVAPGAEFSFSAFHVDKPEYITVLVKNIPVIVDAEFKDPFYVVKGKLPGELKNTVARIAIKVIGETRHCEAESGWLVKISE